MLESPPRAIGDILEPIRVQLTSDGIPINLIGATVQFLMVNSAGGIVVNRRPATIDSAVDGDVSYTFQLSEVQNPGVYKAWFIITTGGRTDTEPDEDLGILVTLYDPSAPITTPDPSIDILTLAKAPGRTRTVEGTVEERSINELVKADQYSHSKDAAAAGQPWGIRMARTRPGGTTT